LCTYLLVNVLLKTVNQILVFAAPLQSLPRAILQLRKPKPKSIKSV